MNDATNNFNWKYMQECITVHLFMCVWVSPALPLSNSVYPPVSGADSCYQALTASSHLLPPSSVSHSILSPSHHLNSPFLLYLLN